MGNNGPDQGQTLAAADRWRTDGTERELAMLIEVRGGRSRGGGRGGGDGASRHSSGGDEREQ